MWLILFSLQSYAQINLFFEKGDVAIWRKQAQIKTKEILPGDSIKTGAKSLAILKNDRETLKIQENSEIVYQPGNNPAKDETIIDLKLGGIISAINKKQFKIKTKSSSMGVRGTQFFASVDDQDKVWMCVNEGSVEVQTEKNPSTMVNAGLGVFVTGGKTSPPKAFAWTKKINWEMDGVKPEEKIDIDTSYEDILDFDYD